MPTRTGRSTAAFPACGGSSSWRPSGFTRHAAGGGSGAATRWGPRATAAAAEIVAAAGAIALAEGAFGCGLAEPPCMIRPKRLRKC